MREGSISVWSGSRFALVRYILSIYEGSYQEGWGVLDGPRFELDISLTIYITRQLWTIYLFGIIVVFGVLCFLGLVWWIVIDPCIRFSGECLTLNVR